MIISFLYKKGRKLILPLLEFKISYRNIILSSFCCSRNIKINSISCFCSLAFIKSLFNFCQLDLTILFHFIYICRRENFFITKIIRNFSCSCYDIFTSFVFTSCDITFTKRRFFFFFRSFYIFISAFVSIFTIFIFFFIIIIIRITFFFFFIIFFIWWIRSIIIIFRRSRSISSSTYTPIWTRWIIIARYTTSSAYTLNSIFPTGVFFPFFF